MTSKTCIKCSEVKSKKYMKDLSKNVFVDEKGVLVFLSAYQYYPANRIREDEKKRYFLGYNEKFVTKKHW